jgi:hypothetical protein
MVTGLWVIYDVIVGVLFVVFLMERPLTSKEKAGAGVLAVIGVVVAVIGWTSESRDARNMDSLMEANAFVRGQLSSVSATLGSLAAKTGTTEQDGITTIVRSAEAKIDQLQAEVAALKAVEPRHLTLEQKQSIEVLLRKKPEMTDGLWIVSYPDCFDCRVYAWEFAEVINKIRPANRKIGVLPLSTYSAQFSTDWRGLIIGSPDPKHLSKEQKDLIRLLDEAHLPHSFQNIVLHDTEGRAAPAVLLVAPQPG